MHVTLYKATDQVDSFSSGAAFAANEEDAEAYLDNPGYGGSQLISVEIEVERNEILSLVDGRRNGVPHGREVRHAWETLGEALEFNDDELRGLRDGSNELIEQAIDSRKIRARLEAAGYLWIVYEDSFPHDAVTWVYTGTETVQIQAVTPTT